MKIPPEKALRFTIYDFDLRSGFANEVAS